MNEPGPHRRITITPAGRRVRVIFAGTVVAETANALRFEEEGYPPRLYIPRADTDMGALTPTARRSHCPYKGDAGYFSVTANGRRAENAVWTYEQPIPAVAAIREYLCFYDSKVDAIEQF
jgi:uncharacterized protein (DUF427 family)